MLRNYITLSIKIDNFISKNTEIKSHMKYEAFHDELTGLKNRRALNEDLESVLKDSLEGSIFMIDLNKIIDDKESDINPDKLFDYILNVANNQPIIMRSYIEKQIDQNEILSGIFIILIYSVLYFLY